ncbi:hypothetical protein PFLG_02453 [Plasmodium falciparum RAJ116]|uniref:RWD domain-containing protein n=1 Tax=Plasmodium falciparum RAJ116 TaxID=580058 RepID=A0A0L0D104_PLAFA|nr:hypothetical protein PFLG_02453 [Plasmodium falciparum RAJ116]
MDNDNNKRKKTKKKKVRNVNNKNKNQDEQNYTEQYADQLEEILAHVKKSDLPKDLMKRNEYIKNSKDLSENIIVDINDEINKNTCLTFSMFLNIDNIMEKYKVTFMYEKIYPYSYPNVVIHMNTKLNEEQKNDVTLNIRKICAKNYGRITLFEICLFINEYLNKIFNNDFQNLWEEMNYRIDDTSFKKDRDNEIYNDLHNEIEDGRKLDNYKNVQNDNNDDDYKKNNEHMNNQSDGIYEHMKNHQCDQKGYYDNGACLNDQIESKKKKTQILYEHGIQYDEIEINNKNKHIDNYIKDTYNFHSQPYNKKGYYNNEYLKEMYLSKNNDNETINDEKNLDHNSTNTLENYNYLQNNIINEQKYFLNTYNFNSISGFSSINSCLINQQQYEINRKKEEWETKIKTNFLENKLNSKNIMNNSENYDMIIQLRHSIDTNVYIIHSYVLLNISYFLTFFFNHMVFCNRDFNLFCNILNDKKGIQKNKKNKKNEELFKEYLNDIINLRNSKKKKNFLLKNYQDEEKNKQNYYIPAVHFFCSEYQFYANKNCVITQNKNNKTLHNILNEINHNRLKKVIHHYKLVRKINIKKIICELAKLTKIHHKYLARYHFSWFEKEKIINKEQKNNQKINQVNDLMKNVIINRLDHNVHYMEEHYKTEVEDNIIMINKDKIK